MGVTKEQAVQNRELILAAAERLFREKGVDVSGAPSAVRPRRILYRYFSPARSTYGRVLRSCSAAA